MAGHRRAVQLPADLIKVGSAVQDTGEALGVVGGLPLVGGSIGEFAGKIEKLGAEVVASGETSRESIRRAAIIAGIAVGVLPAAMALFLYVPVRLRWRRWSGASPAPSRRRPATLLSSSTWRGAPSTRCRGTSCAP